MIPLQIYLPLSNAYRSVHVVAAVLKLAVRMKRSGLIETVVNIHNQNVTTSDIESRNPKALVNIWYIHQSRCTNLRPLVVDANYLARMQAIRIHIIDIGNIHVIHNSSSIDQVDWGQSYQYTQKDLHFCNETKKKKNKGEEE